MLADGWSADSKRILLDGRKADMVFVRTDVQFRLPKTTWHYGAIRSLKWGSLRRVWARRAVRKSKHRSVHRCVHQLDVEAAAVLRDAR